MAERRGIVCELVLMENWRPLQSGTALEVELHNFPSGNGCMGALCLASLARLEAPPANCLWNGEKMHSCWNINYKDSCRLLATCMLRLPVLPFSPCLTKTHPSPYHYIYIYIYITAINLYVLSLWTILETNTPADSRGVHVSVCLPFPPICLQLRPSLSLSF